MKATQGVVIPALTEELHADAVPVETGGVRVTKKVEKQQEVLAQELRKTHVEVKRVKTDRVVDGPQPVRRAGNTLIIPVVSEVLHVEKQWVVTEEIHLTEIEERETVEQQVDVNREVPQIERLDAKGNVVSSLDSPPELAPGESNRPAPASMLSRNDSRLTRPRKNAASASRSLLRSRPRKSE